MRQTNIFDFLIESFTDNISNIEDTRKQRTNIIYSLKDIILSAFSVFYFQNKSWLSFQRDIDTRKGISNAQTMFGISDIPSDNLYCPSLSIPILNIFIFQTSKLLLVTLL